MTLAWSHRGGTGRAGESPEIIGNICGGLHPSLSTTRCRSLPAATWGVPGATRYGEADHPGPAVDEDVSFGHDGCWEVHGCARFRRPHRAGFHRALMDLGAGSDDEEMSEYTFVADTCNSTAWSGARRFLRRTDAHLVLLQEHHLAPERVAEASAWALRNGWHSLFLPAEKGTGCGWRAGVAVFARPHVGLSVPLSGPTEVVPSRVLAASIEPPGFRRTAVLCAYLEDGKGVGHANLRHMEAIGACIGAQGEHVPCIVGGDWQAPPEATAATGFASQASLTLVASLDPRGTYRDVRKASELDYFFLSNDLAMGLDRVEVVEGAGVRPHVPVRLVFRPRLASTRALHVRCPPPPRCLPRG